MATVFDEGWLRLFALRIPRERTKREVDFLVEALSLSPGQRVLDLACGHGRHSLELARRQCGVTGVDASQPAIDLALREAEAEALGATFVCSDACTIDLLEEFDAAICIAALGLGEDREDDQLFLDSAARALAAGGCILIDTINLFWHVRHQDPETWYELDDGTLMLGKGEFDPADTSLRCLSRVIYPSGDTEERRFVVRLYSLPQLGGMLRAAGLRLERTWGDLAGGAHGVDSQRVVVLGTKE